MLWDGEGMPLTCSGQRLGMTIVDILQVRDNPATEEYPALDISGTWGRSVVRYPSVQLAHPCSVSFGPDVMNRVEIVLLENVVPILTNRTQSYA